MSKSMLRNHSEDSSTCDLSPDSCATLLSYLDSTEDVLVAEVGQGRRLVIDLLKQLQDCPMILPALYCQMLGLPVGSTYGQTAISLLEQIRDGNGG